MLKEFAGIDPSGLNDHQLERNIISEQVRRMKERAPGKYGPMLFAVRLIPNMETLYHFGRMADDMVDGDASLPEGISDPYELLAHLDDVTSNFDKPVRGYSIDFMLQRSMEKLERISKGRDDIPGLVHSFIDGMRIEYESRLRRKVFDQQGLAELYKTSFEPSQDITLIALGAEQRSRDLPELAQIQGRSYSVSDLKKDLSVGIIRIPEPIIEESGTSVHELMSCPDCIDGNEILSEWSKSELVECRTLKEDLFSREMDLKTKIMCGFLTFKV